MKTNYKSLIFIITIFLVSIIAVGASAENVTCPSGMVSYWKFDETSGTTAFDSVGAHPGTVVGSTWTTGKVGGALSFDGVDDNVINLGNWFNYQTFTISLWLNPGASQNWYADILDTHHDSYWNWVLQQDQGYTNTYGFHVIQSVILTANTWQHLTITRSDTTCNLYLNGELVNTQNCGIFNYDGNQYLTIGSHYEIPGRFWKGLMDEVAIYNRALSAEEIQQQYQYGLAGEGYCDDIPPVIAPHDNIIAEATSPDGVVVNYDLPIATDNRDANVIVTCTPVSGSIFIIGDTTVTCSAVDAVGNAIDTTFKITVKYKWSGFFQPVDMEGVLNQVKAGSAIPVKFSLGGNMGLNIFAAGYPISQQIVYGSTTLIDTIETTVTAGGSSLTYDSIADQYIYVWKTEKSWSGICRQLIVQLVDGTTQIANFKFK